MGGVMKKPKEAMTDTPTPLNRWVERYRCPIHGPLSTHGCVACSAELALRATLAKRRESLKAAKERTGSSVANEEGER